MPFGAIRHGYLVRYTTASSRCYRSTVGNLSTEVHKFISRHSNKPNHRLSRQLNNLWKSIQNKQQPLDLNHILLIIIACHIFRIKKKIPAVWSYITLQ